MSLLHPHDLLVNIVISLTTPISTSGSPIAKNGLLKKNLNYVFEIEKLEDEYEKMFGKHFHPPDGFLRNKLKKISITVECKSGLDESNTNLVDQLLFYSQNQEFKDTFLREEDRHEILIVCLANAFEQIKKIIEALSDVGNFVIWVATKTRQDKFLVKKEYGTHIDIELNDYMDKGIITLPPISLLLISPHISTPRLISELAKRLLSNMHQPELDIDTFIKRQIDSILPPKKLKKHIEYMITLIPEIAKIENSSFIFKKQLNFELILEKIKFINNLKKSEVNNFLKIGQLTISMIEVYTKSLDGQRTLEEWFKKKDKEINKNDK